MTDRTPGRSEIHASQHGWEAPAGYFDNGVPYNRFGHGSRPLVVFQGLLFENRPLTGFTARRGPGRYEFLEDDYTTWLMTRRAGLPPGFTLRDMSEDYASAIRAAFGGPVDVIGFSTGGSVAQHFAADHPELVRRLVLHSTAHTLGPEARRLQLRLGELARRGDWGGAYGISLRFMLPRRGARRYALAPLAWIVSLLAGSLGAPRDPSDLVVTIQAEDAHHFRSRLHEISAPTLVAAGAEDPYYTRGLFEETAEGIPHARLVLYEGMGHPAHGDQFARDVGTFLTDAAQERRRPAGPEGIQPRL